jgi:MFS family permease
VEIPGGLKAIRLTLAIRDYRLYLIGNVASNIAVWLQKVAIGWLAWELTHSTAWLGIIAMAESAPTLLLSMIAGAVIDRVDYFRILKITQLFRVLHAAAMAALALSGYMNIWFLLALSIMLGSSDAFYRTARLTVVYHLIGRDLLPSAVAVNAIIFNLSRFVGPALGGAIIVAAGAGWAFAVAAALFSVYSVVLRLMSFDCPPVKRMREPMLAEIRGGLRYIVGHFGIRLQLALLVLTGLLAKPLTDLMPGFAGQVFDQGAHGLALLLSAHGIGATTGALMLAGRSKSLRGMTSISIGSILVTAISLLLFAVTPVFWIACVLSGVAGFGFIVQNVTNQTLIQSATDPAFRGRVLSIYGMVAQGVPSLGALLIGFAAEHLGLRIPVASGAALCLLLWWWAWRRRRQLAASLEASPQTQAEAPQAARAS